MDHNVLTTVLFLAVSKTEAVNGDEKATCDGFRSLTFEVNEWRR